MSDVGQDEEAGLSASPAEESAAPPPRRQPAGWMLLLVAALVIAVPVLIGFALIRSGSTPASDSAGSGSEMASDGMDSGGMGGDTSGPAPLPAGVLPFSDIQATEIVIETDPGGSGAILRVDTTTDVACAVAFGPTEELGLIATDSDMAGGGHSVHQPLMRGLNSGTTYFYRVQAIGPDSALYQSDVMQFTYAGPSGGGGPTPPAENVAPSGRVGGVSSEYSDAFSAQNAIDGDLGTEWSSQGDGDDAYIVVEFGETVAVEGVGFRTREMSDGTSITLSFTVTVDGGTTYGPFDAGPGLAVALVEFSAETVRFDVDTSTGGNTGAVEVEVYGEPEM